MDFCKISEPFEIGRLIRRVVIWTALGESFGRHSNDTCPPKGKVNIESRWPTVTVYLGEPRFLLTIFPGPNRAENQPVLLGSTRELTQRWRSTHR